MIRNDDNDRLAKKARTSVCKSSVKNLGNNPRALGGIAAAVAMPTRRMARNYLPSHSMVLQLLLKCLPIRLPNGEGRELVQRQFQHAMLRSQKIADEPTLCATPVRWIREALHPSYQMTPLHSMDDMVAHPGIQNGISEFFLMDVILNREMLQKCTPDAPRNPDDVVMATAYSDVANLGTEADPKYRTLIAFLPGAGVFYCARERRPAGVGLRRSFIPLDASWLRMTEAVSADSTGGRFCFGAYGYVRRFWEGSARAGSPIAAWRVSYSPGQGGLQRLVYRAAQCLDSDGPRMPPDVVGGEDIGAWPAPDRGQFYNEHLALSKSLKVGGRHYAKGFHHMRVPDDCLVIDGADCPHIDIIVDIASSGSYNCRKSVVMVRNLLSPSMDATFIGRSEQPLLVHELRTIALHNSILRKGVAVGGARNSTGDVGAMHPIGTRVLPDGMTTTTYSATLQAPDQLVQAYVHALSRVGQIAFPDVLAVIQDTEGDTGLKPCTLMAGDEVGNRVGFSIDTSVDLGNSSHVDANDASQGYSVWTEDLVGRADDWHFIMPNVHGVHPDGRRFNGIAIKLRHGVAISWDGRVIRHCTSLSRPDGPQSEVLGGGRTTINHLYGTFTAAKERVVHAGRARAAMMLQDTSAC